MMSYFFVLDPKPSFEELVLPCDFFEIIDLLSGIFDSFIVLFSLFVLLIAKLSGKSLFSNPKPCELEFSL